MSSRNINPVPRGMVNVHDEKTRRKRKRKRHDTHVAQEVQSHAKSKSFSVHLSSCPSNVRSEILFDCLLQSS